MAVETFKYDNKIVRNFAYATMLWALVGMLMGVLAAFLMAFPQLLEHIGLHTEWTSFGRLRPVHTNAIIFAFVGNGIFTGVYYSLQRLCKARMFSDALSKIHFWGWQSIIVLAAITLMMGYTSSKEYAELEWPIDILITIIWVVFGWNMFGTIIKRRERHMYVAIWFFIGTFITVAVLHLVNSVALPINFTKSYSMYAGVQDALVQWWYGHNAVAFFLTTPYLGIMYYFIPKAANRPVYSYRLSIIHFWALIFLYIWAGPHHLLYTALPDWAQSLGVVFSIMLIAPSWGGMINGLLTLRGSWDKVRVDPVLKFMVVAVTAYGMATFEGPMLSLKSVNAIAHYTDWIVAHVHVGGLGWNGFLTFGMLYWLIPQLFRTKLYSTKLANTHFWLGTLGILLYAIPMYWAGFTQGEMWKEFTATGQLKYGFLETVTNLVPFYIMRGVGGVFYLSGAVVMVYNLIRTVKQGSFEAETEASAPALEKYVKPKGAHWHSWFEMRPIQMLIGSLIVVSIGGLVEMLPTFLVEENVPTISSVRPYSPLELEGRDIYIKEGCNTCHSQMIRPFRSEVLRYDPTDLEYSKAGEFVYDHPHLWGSKRTGPDLAREGVTNPDAKWHYVHMMDPRSTSEGSVMPAYPWLLEKQLDVSYTKDKITAMRTMGVPYPIGFENEALDSLNNQANSIAAELAKGDIETPSDREIIALIAYLKKLGTDIKVKSN